jgi:uncharacterized membrane protein
MASSNRRDVPTARFADSPYRSLLKAVSWRLTGTFDTVVLAWLITGHAGKAFSIGLAELVTKTLLYYLHERLWNRVPLGRQVVPPKGDYEI